MRNVFILIIVCKILGMRIDNGPVFMKRAQDLFDPKTSAPLKEAWKQCFMYCAEKGYEFVMLVRLYFKFVILNFHFSDRLQEERFPRTTQTLRSLWPRQVQEVDHPASHD